MITYVLLLLSSIAITVLAVRTVTVLRRYTRETTLPSSVPADLPTVSVCIAARNETHALAQCLERVLASDYRKLEILVLDDSSDDDTSLIIKSFAHAGVRFVPGKPIPAGWLGKNHAYQTLIDEASGDILLFIDVDTSIKTSTISNLVATMLRTNTTMLSVLPRREDAPRFSAIAGTMRYYWELLLGTRVNPPAASALWMVYADTLKQVGVGLANYSLSIRSERHMARKVHANGQYLYVIGSEGIGVAYEKHLHSQHETALRLYYPMTGRSLINWMAASIFLTLLVLPIFVIISMLGNVISVVWSILLIIAVAATFGLFVRRTYAAVAWQLRIPLGPLLIAQELILLLMSYVKYRHGTVTWKGRRVNAQTNRHDALRINE